MEKRIEIVCDGCGDSTKTDEYVLRISKAFGVEIDDVHRELWDGMTINEVPVNISGAHVRRVGHVTGVIDG